MHSWLRLCLPTQLLQTLAAVLPRTLSYHLYTLVHLQSRIWVIVLSGSLLHLNVGAAIKGCISLSATHTFFVGGTSSFMHFELMGMYSRK